MRRYTSTVLAGRRIIKVSPDKHLSLLLPLLPLLLSPARTGHLFRLLLEILRRPGPLALGLKNLLEVLFGFFGNRLFFLPDPHDLFTRFEGLFDDLAQGLFVDLCFLGEFKIIVVDPLIQNAGDLLEDLIKVFFELRGKALKQVLNTLLDLLPVDLDQIVFDAVIDVPDSLLQVCHLPLQLRELPHHSLELDVNDALNELLLHFLHTAVFDLDLHRGMNPFPLDFHFLLDLGVAPGLTLREDDQVKFLLTEGRVEHLRVLKLDDLHLLFGLVENVQA